MPGIVPPQGRDTSQRAFENVSSLEKRVAALEQSRGTIITPFSVTYPAAAFSFNYYGGKLWVVNVGGVASASNISALVVQIGVNVGSQTFLASGTGYFNHSAGDATVFSGAVSLYTGTPIFPGSVTANIAAISSPVNALLGFTVNGFVIEAPTA